MQLMNIFENVDITTAELSKCRNTVRDKINSGREGIEKKYSLNYMHHENVYNFGLNP